ncbi:D-alanyl-D-alanine endopeptidase [Gilvimarinus agarilyticus]|uniref:D-alanyl-D-alanine endopeptidase n=1 Tax=unclassified Gilvimarinus TaxID=2642066 RepID=UPI001C088187|nr:MULTISPECIES: D-alanyl-D-alanine endopeptidase [unclassified Gilvimarinus]MBU2887524.1 D-alanyl-D-alanine endopeptidase [Gilvimarinus agarilyticus]MDO6572175.1 D-alanyl-D-alanine endopeptidase [Gilvimarinus sp. 2_MG-2023]MDO6746739.1 D-alanyl-D-alanine endopeptidase [Gilvimarinus sp. 1_MG-2023]
MLRCVFSLMVLLLMPLVEASEVQSPLRLASVSAAVSPLGSDTPVFAKRADWVMPIASVTKIMTAMVVLDSGADLNERLEVSKRHFPAAANAYSRIRPQSRAQRKDLLHIAVMSSENYAAYLLARHHPGGYDAFINAMNEKAHKLGMMHTHFVDSSGLSEQNVSTANDLMLMLKAAFQYDVIRQISTSSKHDVWFTQPGYSLYYANTNPLVRSSRWDVLLSKTGYLSEAGRCLVMVANVEGKPTGFVFLDSFGKRTPLGDAGRTRRWLSGTASGQVATAAARYEKDKAEQLSKVQVATQ